jgi:hypothetical protein
VAPKVDLSAQRATLAKKGERYLTSAPTPLDAAIGLLDRAFTRSAAGK